MGPHDSLIQGPIEKVICKEMVIATKAMKIEKAAVPFEVCVEMITAGGELGINVMMELCQSVLDEKEMWMKSKEVLVLIFKKRVM